MSSRDHIVHFSASSNNESLSEYRPLPVLVKSVEQIFVDELQVKLIEMLDTADDRLFDMSENSYNNAQFDAMRLLRVKREGLITRFNQELTNFFTQTLGKKEGATRSRDNVESLSFENIALVKDDDLEEDIATDGMVNRARNNNQDALEHIRIRIDTLVADKSIEQHNNPVEPVYICEAFRLATQALDLDIASLLVVYKLFDRSVLSQLESVYKKINEFFINKGILPDLKRVAKAYKNPSPASDSQSIIDQMPVNEDNQDVGIPLASGIEGVEGGEGSAPSDSTTGTNTSSDSGVLSVIQQLLANHRGGGSSAAVSSANLTASNVSNSPAQRSSNPQVKIDTSQLMQVLSNLQVNQTAAVNPNLNLRDSIDHQVPSVVAIDGDIKDVAASLGQFNEDMIDIVSMLFDFILEDRNLSVELKSVIGRLQIPMLKVGLVDKTFFSNRLHSARLLLNELAYEGISLNIDDPSSKPMFEKISSVAEIVINEFRDDVTIFEGLLEDFLSFKKANQQRAKIFERRTREAEEGKAKTETSRGEVNKRLTAICRGHQIPDVVKLILKNIWSHVMLLERLKDNREGWKRRVKVAQLLVWTVQPITSAIRLEKMTSRVPILIKSLREGIDVISFSTIEASHLFEQLEKCHRQIIDDARKEINKRKQEEVLRLPAINVDVESVDFDKLSQGLDSLQGEDDEVEIVEEAIVIEDIGFTREQTGQRNQESVEQPVEISPEVVQTIEHLRAGSWVDLEIDGDFKRCKLAARISSSEKYIFVNRSGLKMADFLTSELCLLMQSKKMRILDDEALFDRALESVISNLRSMKAQA